MVQTWSVSPAAIAGVRCSYSCSPTLHAQRPHRPAKVVTVHREVRHRLMHLPVLGKATGLPYLPPVPVAVAAVVPLDEHRVHQRTHQRQRQRRQHRPLASRTPPALLTFTTRPFFRSLWTVAYFSFLGSTFTGFLGRPGRPVRGCCSDFRIGLEDRRLVRRILVRRHQIHEPAAGAFLEVVHQQLRVRPPCVCRAPRSPPSGVPGQRPHGPSYRPLRRASGIVGVAVLLLLADKRPLLIELHFAGLRGKKPRARRGLLGRVGRRPRPVARPCSCSPRPGDWSAGRRNFSCKCWRTERAFSSGSLQRYRARAFAFGEAFLAGAAGQDAAFFVGAIAEADAEVVQAAAAVVGTVRGSGSRRFSGRPYAVPAGPRLSGKVAEQLQAA